MTETRHDTTGLKGLLLGAATLALLAAAPGLAPHAMAQDARAAAQGESFEPRDKSDLPTARQDSLSSDPAPSPTLTDPDPTPLGQPEDGQTYERAEQYQDKYEDGESAAAPCDARIAEVAEAIPQAPTAAEAAERMGVSTDRLQSVVAALAAARMAEGTSQAGCTQLVQAAQSMLEEGETAQ